MKMSPDDWSKIRCFQTLELSDLSAWSSMSRGTDSTPPEENIIQPPQGALSPIAEEESFSAPSRDGTDSLFIHDDPELQKLLLEVEALHDFAEPVIELPSSAFDYSDYISDEHLDASGPVISPPIDCYHVVAANMRAGLPSDCCLHGTDDYTEVYYEGDTWKLLSEVPRPPQEGEVVVLRVSYGDATRRAVVKRDDDTLTAAEIEQHKDEVDAAMLQELRTWSKFTCFSRKLRRDARNIIDCRWVLKWKWEHDVTDATSGQSSTKASRRVIRARLTVRGFKDMEKHTVDRYAGTSQRYSQRIIASEAVLRGWDIATTDISKAFLQGVTYAELAQLTGEPLREVNFYLPAANVSLLRQVAGFEDFNPALEVLHCDKPGTGSVDAPRCFSLKLSICTTQDCGMQPSSVDPELCMLHHKDGSGNLILVCLLTKHVDDVKITGERQWIEWVLNKLQATFGKLKILWNEFTNCGVRHTLDKSAQLITLDQIEYGKTLRTITHSELRTLSSETECGHELHQLYMSLLGAVAYLYLTRMDILVFICACQRYAHKPKIIHVKRLNVIVRWIQRNPKKLVYRALKKLAHHLCVVSDAAFKKEEEKGHSLRGSVYLRVAGNTVDCFHLNGLAHILECVCKALRHVTRSTFSSELHACCDSVDLGILILLMLHELEKGPVTKAQARQLRDEGGYAIPMTLQIDALSVFAAITATYIKHPAEKGLLSHVQFVRELLDTRVVQALIWIDTRDMMADGLTKGSVDRDVLHSVMNGFINYKHEFKLWQSKLAKAPQRLIEEADRA